MSTAIRVLRGRLVPLLITDTARLKFFTLNVIDCLLETASQKRVLNRVPTEYESANSFLRKYEISAAISTLLIAVHVLVIRAKPPVTRTLHHFV